MEAKNMKGNSKSKEKKKGTMKIVGGGGHIGGFVAVGGALVVAGLFATFVVKRRKRRVYSKTDEQVCGNQGLTCLLQTPSTTSSDRGQGDSSIISDVMQEDAPLAETDDGIVEEKMIVSDYSEKEISVFRDDSCAEIQNGSNKEVEKTVNLVGDEDEDEEYVAGNENEGCESADFNAGIVSPTEITEDKTPKRETYEPQRSDVQEAKTLIADEHIHFSPDIVFNDHATAKCLKVNEKGELFSKVRAWILSMLMIVLLLMSLATVSSEAKSVVLSFLS